ncbi:hypothetical protein [Bauldia sp.]|uniref:hypothetical protein n=1 Tax=Bauldia sp. TaxID=2575872 RepID=UPI003BA90EC8
MIDTYGIATAHLLQRQRNKGDTIHPDCVAGLALWDWLARLVHRLTGQSSRAAPKPVTAVTAADCCPEAAR